MMTAEQDRIYRLGKVRALLHAAYMLLEDANRTVPAAEPNEVDRENVLGLHERIRKGMTATENAINWHERIKP